MSKPFTRVAAILLGVVAVLHLLRVIMDWDLSVAGEPMSHGVSLAAFVITGVLAGMVWREIG